MPGAKVDGTKQDAFRVTPRNRDMGLFALQSPRTTQDGKEAQHRLLLTKEHGVGWELPEPCGLSPLFLRPVRGFLLIKIAGPLAA